jgi:hypothetical protein
MKSTRRRPYTWPLLLALSFAVALAFWFTKLEPEFTPKMILILGLAVVLLALPLYRSVQQARDESAGIPLEDEMSKERRVLAGARAFHLSFYLWLAIFVFNSKFSDAEEMLGVGILGSAALYGLCWFQLRIRGHQGADQD